MTKNTLNQYSILPPIGGNSTITNNFRSAGSANSALKEYSSAINDQARLKDIPPLNFNDGNQNGFERASPFPQSLPPPPPPPPMMMMNNNEDSYLPEEPVLLTDYEEESLSDRIRSQLANSVTVEKLKLFYQELANYDPNVTSYIHYSNIQLVASQLGVRFIFMFLHSMKTFFSVAVKFTR